MERRGPVRVLLVDDEPVVRQIVERTLSASYEVATLPSSEQLEWTLQHFFPDIVILDIRMPEEDGWHLCSRLRRDRRFDEIPIVFLSGFHDEASVRKGYASGGDFFLPKPFELAELSRTIDALIGRKHCHPDEPRDH